MLAVQRGISRLHNFTPLQSRNSGLAEPRLAASGCKQRFKLTHHPTTTGLDLPSLTEWGIAALLPPARLGVFEISAFFFSETHKPC